MKSVQQVDSDVPSVCVLPVLDGEPALSILKEDPATRDIPTVAMSAGVNLKQHATVSKADGMLSKPFDIGALLAQIILRAKRPESQRLRS